MKTPIIAIIISLLAPLYMRAAEDTLFKYPEAPDTMSNMTDRCSYVIDHFWDRCNFNHAFTVKEKLNGAMGDYFQLMPYADETVAINSINKLIEKVRKNPTQLLTLAEMAEGYLYSDTARIIWDAGYYPFAEAVASHKKIKQADKARFVAQERILGGSQVGMIAPDITFIDKDGKTKKLSEIPAGYVILFFNEPDCSDCMMTRVRLSADYNINQFIEKGQLNIVSIYPGSAKDAEWIEGLKRVPENWIAGASEEADQLYDMRNKPVIYYLNNRHKILSKSMTADQLIRAFQTINTRTDKAE